MSLNSGYWTQSISKKDSLGQDYCYIPDANFLYGKEKISSKIAAPFYMAKFPVTNIQFRHFVNETGYNYDLFDIMEQLSPEPGSPATPISWQNAKSYARWLRSITGEYYSLPNEEEWELAARGTDGRMYPWGNEPPTRDHGIFSIASHRSTTGVVGSHPYNTSPYGCQDMIGNIWEWCLDDVDEFGEAHVLRGGSCVNDAAYCNCTARCFESPSEKRVLYAGFRLIYLPEDMYERYRGALTGEIKVQAPPVRKPDGLKWEKKDLTQTLRHSDGWRD